ncbi:GGDEF domain-containing protein [Deinococcus sonorensis]|uniref:GGDEF domain-containing protein n=2 Tax=Deinococcus sonorensis TaxID=309891 RepID=A0AAU7U7W8_9DEIO
MTSPGLIPPSLTDLRDELQALQQQIDQGRDRSITDVALLHRDAVYLALDTGDPAIAMTHALACLELARVSRDRSLEAKAHVAIALVQADTYDDLGADAHFQQAEMLAREAGDQRGVALVAVNRSHHEMDRDLYADAATRLHGLLHSPFAEGLRLGESAELLHTFHINYTVSASEALIRRQLPEGLRDEVQAELQHSVALLTTLNAQRTLLRSPLRVLDVLDALSRHAVWSGALDQAIQMGHESVQLAANTRSTTLYGHALRNRARAFSRSSRWDEAVADLEQAIAQFELGQQDLLAARAREALANAYARSGRFQEAFETQREVTRRVLALYRDVYQQRALLKQIEQQARDAEVRAAAFAEAAMQDPLTGAPNRAFAMQRLARLREQARQGPPSVVVLLDLDHFKRVNDTYGHAVGDAVLIRVVRALSAEIRDQDCLARFGGEEFVVILHDLGLEAAQEVCHRLRSVLERLVWDDVAAGLQMTASFGLARLDGRRDLKATLRAADEALYAAKAAGRNAVSVSEPWA